MTSCDTTLRSAEHIFCYQVTCVTSVSAECATVHSACAYLLIAVLAEVNIEFEALINPRTERKPARMAVKRVERWVHIAMAGHRQRRHPLHVTVVRDHG